MSSLTVPVTLEREYDISSGDEIKNPHSQSTYDESEVKSFTISSSTDEDSTDEDSTDEDCSDSETDLDDLRLPPVISSHLVCTVCDPSGCRDCYAYGYSSCCEVRCIPNRTGKIDFIDYADLNQFRAHMPFWYKTEIYSDWINASPFNLIHLGRLIEPAIILNIRRQCWRNTANPQLEVFLPPVLSDIVIDYL